MQGGVLVSDNPALITLSLPMLAEGGGLEISANGALLTAELSRLRRLSGYLLISSPGLRTLSLPVLESVGQRVDLHDNGLLEGASDARKDGCALGY